MKRPVVAALLAILLPASHARASDFADSIARATGRAANASEQARSAARGENPYLVPGLVLVGGGATLALWGLLSTTGVECTSDPLAINVKCDTTSNKGLTFAGLGAAGVGAILLWRGEQQRHQPEIVVQRGKVAVAQRFRW